MIKGFSLQENDTMPKQPSLIDIKISCFSLQENDTMPKLASNQGAMIKKF